MSTQKKDQYRETVPHKSHFVPVSVHTTKIEIPTETDGVAALPEKNFPALYLHWHPELEFFYVEEGEVEFFIENHAFLVFSCLQSLCIGQELKGLFYFMPQ